VIVRVAVIDSGIHADHPHVGGVAGGVEISPGGETADYLDRLGHGTAVAGAIREKAPDALLYAVKVFDRRLAASVETILRGIEWAIENRMDIINLSLGTHNPDHRRRFEQVVERAVAARVLIVSALQRGDQLLLPGSLDGVLAVGLDWDCPRDTYRTEAQGGRTVYYASGYPRPVPGVPPQQNLNGISFAVANMTGFVAREMTESAWKLR
jgi:subtilisin family serine protease